MNFKYLILTATAPLFLFSSCSKKLKEAELRYNNLNTSYMALQGQMAACRDSSAKYLDRIKALNDQLSNQQTSNSQMLQQLKDLSVISGSQAESIKKSLENIGAKDAYIKDLQSAISRKDSLNMALVMNLKGAIGNLDDQDINIKVDKGVVYIDISDKLLFKSGRYEVNQQAKVVLGKVATVLKNQPDIEFMVEGHTDNVPYRDGVLLDNWDLSVKRATSVVRILQSEYGVPAARMTAAGRGEYIPLASNDTDSGRATNRRTRIVILPELDQFFKLLESPQRK
ncbi:OmpA/MotB family protein [Desertivirga xinjiangensis]|uniref:OmpA/MotB family protein n=1 Tax=Desertivirga xinjiangensis TaxID=539206 RepID=UPI002109206E|nr:OmpA family protein [Pedobacter xinjiangensis]